MPGLIVGDTSEGAMTLQPTASGVRFIFKHGDGKPFATFELANDKCLWVAKKLTEMGNRQHPNGIILKGD